MEALGYPAGHEARGCAFAVLQGVLAVSAPTLVPSGLNFTYGQADHLRVHRFCSERRPGRSGSKRLLRISASFLLRFLGEG